LWRASTYWQPYAQRIAQEIERRGLAGVRSNQAILKGYAEGGVLRPTLPGAAWKRMLWRAAAGLPVVSRIVGEYERLLHAYTRRLERTEVALAVQVLDRIAGWFPGLRIPDGVCAGGAADLFIWRDAKVSAAFVPYLARAADFYRQVPAAEIHSLIEIGPGLGFSTLAHVALNPGLRLIVNVDLFPVIYVSGRFLAASRDLVVHEASRLPVSGPFAVDAGQDRPAVYAVPSWRFPDIQGKFDYAFNAYSFQEMEEEICRAYAARLSEITRHGIHLLSRVDGHRAGAGGQGKPITLSFLEGLFWPAFPVSRELACAASAGYGIDSRSSRLLLAPHR
jgi:putative sugar O-methyltransferase